MAMSHWRDFVDADGPDGAYLSWKKVELRVGISRTTAWRLQKTGDFPKPYVMSPGRVAYRESEVEAWKASRGHRAPPAVVQAAEARPPRAPATAATASDAPAAPSERPNALAAAVAPTPPPRPLARPGPRARRPRPCGDQMTLDF